MFLCFSPVQFENFLYGIQLEPLFPGIAVVAVAIVNLSDLSLRLKTLINCSLAFVATYTFANGMLVWALALPFPGLSDSTPRRSRATWYAIYCLAGIVAIGSYFVGYTRPVYHPKFASLQANYLELAHYLILWIGGYFASDYLNPFLFGIAALTIFTGVGTAVIWISLERKANWRAFYPWLLIAAYAVITGAVTAFGRLGLYGAEQALGRRYTVFSLFFYVALVGLTYAIYCTRIRPEMLVVRVFFVTNIVWLVGLAAVAWVACYRTNLISLYSGHRYRAKLLRAVEWIDVAPENPDLALVFPYVDILRDRTRVLAQHGFLRVPFIKDPLRSEVQQSPQAENGANGEIETCQFDRDHGHAVVITGWAWLRDRGERAHCVVVGYRDKSDNFKPVTVLETGLGRPDLRDRTHISKIYYAGFSGVIDPIHLGHGDILIQGWAIDLKGQKAFPLASSAISPVVIP